MNFYVLTLFPQMIADGLNHSMLKRAVSSGIIEIYPIDIRNFADGNQRQADDAPYGGGAGMVMMPMPVYMAYDSIREKVKSGTKVVYMTPQGMPFTQKKAEELAKEEDLIVLCGHYEGIDERVIEEIVTDEISVGDYVLTGGELPAMVVIDAVSRLLPGVLNNEGSAADESFSNGLLEYPQYTRPFDFRGRTVPEVLLSGHHKNIADWRHEQALERTRKKRPDLL